jgi:hypothetical protein
MKSILAAVLLLIAPPTFAGQVPATMFFSGNDVYDWCQHEHGMAQSYVAGMYDATAHGAIVIDDMRNNIKDPTRNNDSQVDFALNRVANFCTPEHVTVQQMTDVFCQYLKNEPAKRDGLPSLMFQDALKAAWPCH